MYGTVRTVVWADGRGNPPSDPILETGQRPRVDPFREHEPSPEISEVDRLRCATVKKLPSDVLKFFKGQGARGGRICGKRSLESMTAEQRAARAKKAEGTTRKRVASGNGPVA